MNPKLVALAMLIASIVVMLSLVINSFVSYVPMSGSEMQNLYISKILVHSAILAVLNLACIYIIASSWRNGSRRSD